MDSAAAYSMALPDEGAARWTADCAFACTLRSTMLDSYFSAKFGGSGTIEVDYGDGTVEELQLPASITSRAYPSGSYLFTVRGPVETVQTFSGMVEAVWRAPAPAVSEYGSWPYRAGLDTFVCDADSVMFPPKSISPRRVILRGLSRSGWIPRSTANPGSRSATIPGPQLEEFYAPLLPGSGFMFDTADASYNQPPFAQSPNLRVVYIPSVTEIPFQCFVSPSARGVKVYVGRLTSVRSDAFRNQGPYQIYDVPLGGCDVELFCKNTSSEMIALGFPFGADYLKCHCTDVTFDSLGYRFRESDGRRYDPANGQLVNDDFKYVDEAGHLVKYHEGLARWLPCDEHGFYVDGDDLPIDPVTGFWIDREGHVCDEYGRKCDTLGNLVAYRYWNPDSADDSMQPVWYADDSYGVPDDYRNVEAAEYGPFWQYVVDRLGGKVAARGNVNLGNGMYVPGDPRADMWYENVLTDDGYFDYYDAKGFLRARERSYEDGGAVYSVVYDGGREWHLELYSSGEGE